MRFLLDTHAIFWVLEDNPQFPKEIKVLLQKTTNKAFISDASLFEFAIKFSIGKLNYKNGLADLYNDIELAGFEVLSTSQAHYLAYLNLPLMHRDPFDRLIIAQAQYEKLTIISRDKQFEQYPIKLLW